MDPALSRHYKAEVNNLVNEIVRLRRHPEVAILRAQLKEDKEKHEADLDAAVLRAVELEEELADEKRNSTRQKLMIHLFVCLVVLLFLCRYVV